MADDQYDINDVPPGDETPAQFMPSSPPEEAAVNETPETPPVEEPTPAPEEPTPTSGV